MEHRFTIVGIGEALFDIFSDAQRPGGASLNLAVHAHQLAAPRSGRGVLVSRVGQDPLGDDILAELRQRDMSTEFIQTDPDRPTGRVYIDLGDDGQPRYDILSHAAWDVLQFDPDIEELARRCEALCFGSLAQRDAQSRNTIYRFLDACPRAIRMFDANLRPDQFNQQVLRRSCELANILKADQQELHTLHEMIGRDIDDESDDAVADALRQQYELDMLVLTRGKDGTRIYSDEGAVDGQPVDYPPADTFDPVGAGDAAAAAVLVGRVLRWPAQRIADLANHCGAFVASQPGATPALPESILQSVK